VIVGLEHVLDANAVQAAQVEVGIDVPLRVDHRGDAGRRVPDQVGGAAQILVDYLAEEHWGQGSGARKLVSIAGDGNGAVDRSRA
jgi:hypothetical protein